MQAVNSAHVVRGVVWVHNVDVATGDAQRIDCEQQVCSVETVLLKCFDGYQQLAHSEFATRRARIDLQRSRCTPVRVYVTCSLSCMHTFP
jgi:hypothetical protein